MISAAIQQSKSNVIVLGANKLSKEVQEYVGSVASLTGETCLEGLLVACKEVLYREWENDLISDEDYLRLCSEITDYQLDGVWEQILPEQHIESKIC